MGRISEQTLKLRMTTVKAVEMLIESGQATNIKHSLEIIFKKNVPCGFVGNDFNKKYEQFRKFSQLTK